MYLIKYSYGSRLVKKLFFTLVILIINFFALSAIYGRLDCMGFKWFSSPFLCFFIYRSSKMKKKNIIFNLLLAGRVGIRVGSFEMWPHDPRGQWSEFTGHGAPWCGQDHCWSLPRPIHKPTVSASHRESTGISIIVTSSIAASDLPGPPNGLYVLVTQKV